MSTDVGAVLEVLLDAAEADERLTAWSAAALRLAQSLGWGDAAYASRLSPGSAQLFLAAPADQLMTATDVNEAAWVEAEGGTPLTIAELQARSAREATPRLVALQRAAAAHGVSFSFDDEGVSVGSGATSRSWPRTALPDAASLPWAEIRDVPIALVAGSNGKTTTARLLSAMLQAAGHTVGMSSTDGVVIGGESVASGDFSGPVGARMAARDPRVTAAVLESARGGMLRRGLGLSRADVAVITNVTADHFGEYGVHDLATLADAKLIVARALGSTGTLVLNGDDPTLRVKSAALDMPIVWFSRNAGDRFIRVHLDAGGMAGVQDGNELLLHAGGDTHRLGHLDDIPIAHGGAAGYNIANALGAALAAHSLGVPLTAIRNVLRSFGTTPDDNAGRLDIRTVRGITLIIDYAHNPAGLAALCAVAAAVPAARRLLVLGQAGDRDDTALQALARAAWTGLRWDRVLIKGMASLYRGRNPGEVEGLLVEALREAGADASQIEVLASELEAAQRALAWAEAGDLVVLPLHAERAAVMEWLDTISR